MAAPFVYPVFPVPANTTADPIGATGIINNLAVHEKYKLDASALSATPFGLEHVVAIVVV